MKMKKLKQILAIAMVVMMAVVFMPMLPGVNGEAKATTITNELDFTTASRDVTGDGYTWINSTKTLTLSGIALEVSSASDSVIAVKLPDEATIVAAQGTTNTIKATSTYDGKYSYGIYSPGGKLKIEGTGNLNISSNAKLVACGINVKGLEATQTCINIFTETASEQYNILSQYGVTDGITISDGAKVTTTSTESCTKGCNIYAESGAIDISGGSAIKTENGVNGIHASKGGINIDNASVTVDKASNCGILSNSTTTGSDIIISDSTVKISNTQNIGASTATGDVRIDNSTISVKNDDDPTYEDQGFNYGIVAFAGDFDITGNRTDIDVDGGVIGLLAGSNSGDTKCDLRISAGDIDVDVTKEGLWAKTALKIYGGDVDVAAHGASDSSAKALYSQGTILVDEGADVTAKCVDTAVETEKDKYGMRAKGGISIKNPENLVVAGETAAFNTDTGSTSGTPESTTTADITSTVSLRAYTDVSGTTGKTKLTPATSTGIIQNSDTYKYVTLPVYCTVKYDTQGIGNAPESQMVEKDELATKPTDPADSKHTFGGWYTDKACTTAWDFTKSTVTNDTTLYAKWTDKYTVSYDTQGIGNAPESQIVEAGDLATKPTDPTDSNHIFGGWYTDKACTIAWDFAKSTVTKDVTLYAKWTEKGSAEDFTVTADKQVFSFNGTKQTPAVTVKNAAGTTLVSGTEYTIDFPDSINVGDYTATVKGIGSYIGEKTIGYTINPAAKAVKKVVPAKKKLTVKWAKTKGDYLSQTTGYQVKVSTTKSFAKSKTKTVNIGAKKTYRVFKGLKSHKKYYVKMRAYKKISTETHTKTYYSTWSKVKTKKTK